jgi:hypothetical protein
VDHQFSYIYYLSLSSYTSSIPIIIVFWAIGHLLAKQESQRSTWPAIILGLGVADLGNLVIAWITPLNTGFPQNIQTLPTDIGLTLLPTPVLLILGGIIGLIAARHPLQ